MTELSHLFWLLPLYFLDFGFMNTSGVSLLASRLKSHAQRPAGGAADSTNTLWNSHESVKLTDSGAGQSTPFSVAPVEYLRAHLQTLIRQTNAQEQALLRYQEEITRQAELIEKLEKYMLHKSAQNQKRTIFQKWRRSSKTVSNEIMTPQPSRAVTPGIAESVNLNDTLRNLAMSLQSPLNDHANSLLLSTSSAISAPFKTVRTHKLQSN